MTQQHYIVASAGLQEGEEDARVCFSDIDDVLASIHIAMFYGTAI